MNIEMQSLPLTILAIVKRAVCIASWWALLIQFLFHLHKLEVIHFEIQNIVAMATKTSSEI